MQFLTQSEAAGVLSWPGGRVEKDARIGSPGPDLTTYIVLSAISMILRVVNVCQLSTRFYRSFFETQGQYENIITYILCIIGF